MSCKKESTGDNSEDAASQSEDGAATEPLATTRSRRANAGNRMGYMIQDEADDFYANLYGGFEEEEDDADFEDEEEEEQDFTDSDFSIDETDEIAPEHQAIDEEPKKRKGYKEPRPKEGSSSTKQTRVKPSPSSNLAERSFRDSTRKKTEETIKNLSTVKKRKKVRNLELWKPLTHEEMLEEAKITEDENLKSLETYQRLESEKLKKMKQVKKMIPPPYVNYSSTTLPILDTEQRYSRNFLTFVPGTKLFNQ